MSTEKFNDDCDGCKPVVLDPRTHKQLPPEHPVVTTVMDVWVAASKAEREAFHQLTCLNSRTPKVLAIVSSFNERIQATLRARNN